MWTYREGCAAEGQAIEGCSTSEMVFGGVEEHDWKNTTASFDEEEKNVIYKVNYLWDLAVDDNFLLNTF